MSDIPSTIKEPRFYATCNNCDHLFDLEQKNKELESKVKALEEEKKKLEHDYELLASDNHTMSAGNYNLTQENKQQEETNDRLIKKHSQHRSGTEVGVKIYKFFGYDVDFMNRRDKHWWVEKGDFNSLPFKSTNGSVCSDHKTLQEAIISAQESNEREGLEP